MEELIGKTIKKIFMNEDIEIYFELSNGEMIGYQTEGECCSHSWFAHLDGIEALLNATVESTDWRMNLLKEDEYGDVVKQYGIGLRTDKGYATIEFRNSSNGYYGGSYTLIECIPDNLLRKVTKDF